MCIRDDTSIRPALEADCADIASRLRAEDRAGIEALTGLSPERYFKLGLDRRPTVLCVNGRPEMIFHCGRCPTAAPTVGRGGFVGMASSLDVFRNERLLRLLLRGGRRMVRCWNDHFPVLWTVTGVDNAIHHQLLRFLKFDLGRRREQDGWAYYPAIRRREPR